MGGSSFEPTPAEFALVSQIFAQSDPKKIGIITGDVAVTVFSGAGLSPTVLGEIWAIADEENNGWLSRKGVAIAVRLMGWAQKGEKITPALVNKQGPLPVIDGIPTVKTHSTGLSLPRSPPPGLPPLTAQDKLKFRQLFARNNPVDGLLSGEQARDIFVKFKLPFEKLSQIWNLADTQDRGALDAADFVIALYFIQACMTGQLTTVPTILPPGLYEQARSPPQLPQTAPRAQAILTHTTGSGFGAPLSPILDAGYQRTLTKSATIPHTMSPGQNQTKSATLPHTMSPGPNQTPKPIGVASRIPAQVGMSAFQSSVFPPVFPRTGVNQHQAWDVTAAEKADSDHWFDDLDQAKEGYITGEAAVPFMLKSNLNPDDLAVIWDLSDFRRDGKLTRDAFAVAMHLIRRKLAGKDIPTSVSPTLVPPSMRTEVTSAPQLVQEPQADLFTWDDSPTSSTFPQPKGLSSQPTGSTQSAIFPSSAFAQQSLDPFGSSNVLAPPAHKNLLDDEDQETSSPPLHDQSAEIGNLQNQVNSTMRSLENAKTERASLEQRLATQASQLSALQTQLSSAKAAYETETRLSSTLRDRFNAQTADIQKSKEELIRAESDLSAVRVEKAEIEGSFLRDKEDARDLHRKMVEAGQQAEALKLEVEKVRKEAKQQKGLLAIARKQLSTKEAERVKAENELEKANEELGAVVREKETVEGLLEMDRVVAEAAAATQSVIGHEHAPSSGVVDQVQDPTPSQLLRSASLASMQSGNVAKSNNPFDRLVMSSATSSPRSVLSSLPVAGAPPNPAPPPTTKSDTAEPEVPPNDDPFEFTQTVVETSAVALAAFVPEAPKTGPVAAVAAVEENGKLTPKSRPADIAIPISTSQISSISPNTDTSDSEFATPPTTSKGLSRAASPADPGSEQHAPSSTFADLNGAASQFPPVEVDFVSRFPEAEIIEGGQDAEASLKGKVSEIELEETDSSSDEDEEGVPLAQLAQKKKGAQEQATPFKVSEQPTNGAPNVGVVPDFDSILSQLGPSSTNTAPPQVPVPVPKAASVAEISSFSQPFVPPPTNDTTKAAAPPQAVTGLNAFDEAMGKISGGGQPPSASASSPPTQFTFDSAFEDDFDFASASEAKLPSEPKAVNGGEPSHVVSPPFTNDALGNAFPSPARNDGKAPAVDVLSFDDTFALNGKPTTTASPPPAGLPPPVPTGSNNLFDEVFSAFDSSVAPAAADGLMGSSSVKTSQESSVPGHISFSDAPTTPKTFPTVSPPSSPNSGPPPRTTSIRPGSPTSRQKSPPPRFSPPKTARPSTATSSKDPSHEKPKDPPPRHSKLSIRLPFGRKKKHQESLPPPPSAVQDEPTEPAFDDDVEVVKQLCGMGFGRSKVVSALEVHGYDMGKALNSLVG